MAPWRWLAGLAAAGLFLACTYYDPSLLAPTGEGSGGEAGAGGDAGAGGEAGQGGGGAGGAGSAGAAGSAGSAGGGASGAAGSDACALVKPPTAPSSPGSPTEGPELLITARSIDLGEDIVGGKPKYLGFGYDLDGYCTCPGPPSCKGSKQTSDAYCDGEGGRDNAGGALVSFVSKLVSSFSSKQVNDSITKGKFSLAFRLRGYNGEPNDDKVEVTWLILGDFYGAHGNTKPVWDGNDDWPVRDTSFEADGTTPLFVDKNAIVADGQLVAALPGGSLPLQEIDLNLTSPFLVGKLQPPDGTSPVWRISGGIIAARWKTQNILSQLGSFVDPLSMKPLCTDNQFYVSIKQQVCDFADITSGIQPPTAPCDALSLGLSFEAYQAKLGGMQKTDPASPKCAPEVDPAGDDCLKLERAALEASPPSPLSSFVERGRQRENRPGFSLSPPPLHVLERGPGGEARAQSLRALTSG